MDLTTIINDTKLKIRVAGILSTPNGFLFEKSDGDYIFLTGGKIRANETSKQAMKREILEEVGIQVEDLTLCSILENLYKTDTEKVHEICFVYKTDIVFNGAIPKGFVEVPIENIDKYDIRPSNIVEILKNKDSSFKHFVIK